MTALTPSERVETVQKMVDILKEHQAFENKTYPVRSHWASKIGHPCIRYLYYMRTDWDKAKKKDWKGIGIRGNLIAQWWIRFMQEKGFSVIHEELPLSQELFKQLQISGRIDGRIMWPSLAQKPVVYEFKTVNEHYYDKLNTYEDFMEAKQEYVKMYPAQIQMYLYDNNEEAGLFIICNPLTLEWKPIIVYLDLEYVEYLLKRIELVNKALTIQTPPERIAYGNTCRKCDFSHICVPDIINEGLELVDNDDLEAKLLERQQLQPNVERYVELDDDCKAVAKKVGKDFVVNTSFKVEIKTSTGKRIDTKKIPIEERPKYEVPSSRTEVSFIPLEQAKV